MNNIQLNKSHSTIESNSFNDYHSMNQIQQTKRIQPMNQYLSSEFNLLINNTIINLERIHTMSNTKEMTKAELIKLTDDLYCQLKIIGEELLDKDNSIRELELKLESSSKDGRKSQVLAILKEFGPISIMNIAHKLNISTKNVSSQLTYLRSDNNMIFTDHNGLKFLYEAVKVESDSTDEDDSTI